MDLIGMAGIMELLNLSRARADQLSRQKEFPDPVQIIDGRVRVWERAEVERWARENGRIK